MPRLARDDDRSPAARRSRSRVVAATAILFGLLPALVSARTAGVRGAEGRHAHATGVRGRRWNRALVVAEVALACAVLVASALLVRSVTRMMHAPTGVDRRRRRHRDAAVAGRRVYRRGRRSSSSTTTLLDVRAAPARRRSAGAANALAARSRLAHAVRGRRPSGAARRRLPIAQHVSVSSGYFEAFRARLLRGPRSSRTPTAATPSRSSSSTRRSRSACSPARTRSDDASSRWPQQIGPLGRNLSSAAGPPFRIVGVVADIHQAPLGQAAEPVHLSHAAPVPVPRDDARRARTGHGGRGDTAMRTALRALDPSLPLEQRQDDGRAARDARPRRRGC